MGARSRKFCKVSGTKWRRKKPSASSLPLELNGTSGNSRTPFKRRSFPKLNPVSGSNPIEKLRPGLKGSPVSYRRCTGCASATTAPITVSPVTWSSFLPSFIRKIVSAGSGDSRDLKRARYRPLSKTRNSVTSSNPKPVLSKAEGSEIQNLKLGAPSPTVPNCSRCPQRCKRTSLIAAGTPTRK